MIGFVDLERIAEDMRDLENGIQKFVLFDLILFYFIFYFYLYL